MHIRYYIGIVLTGWLIMGCTPKDFTNTEKELIRSQAGNVMRLYTTDNLQDSLFLRRRALVVEPDLLGQEEYRMLKAGLLRTVQDSANPGVGIAAPQVGIGRRMIVVQRFDKTAEPFEVYLNPEIIFYSEDKKSGPEGCLSIPEKSGDVRRSVSIVVRYMDENTYAQCQDTVNGFTAVIFQHETDHLEGILFTDRIEKE